MVIGGCLWPVCSATVHTSAAVHTSAGLYSVDWLWCCPGPILGTRARVRFHTLSDAPWTKPTTILSRPVAVSSSAAVCQNGGYKVGSFYFRRPDHATGEGIL
jgi:hypothetical protein